MSDREEIQELMARYGYAIDLKDYAALTDCFAPDATALYPAKPEPVTGATAIVDMMKVVLERLDATTHNFSNFIIEVNGDTARMRANIIAQHVRNGFPKGDKLLAGARYDAQVKKVGGKWKIANVKTTSVWRDGNLEIMTTPR